MSGHPSWRLLPASAPGIPALLVSTAFAADSYSVHLSDLANLWVERMDRRPIIMRGMVEDTSIDPSDGPDQIRKMLELLRAAFDSSDPEHGNTSLTLARGEDGDSLTVQVTCLLPKPLKPFRWPLHLKKCPQSTVASELVLPMIQAHEARTGEIAELIALLREKDAVITRLIDKLEATGTGLEHVFNALSGKRRVTRATAEGKVKGLAVFSESEFRSKATDLRPVAQASDVSALLRSVFGGAGLQYKSDVDLEASTELDNWWTKLAKGQTIALSERAEKKETQKPSRSQEQEPEPRNEEEDDFQVQATPPGVRSARKRDSASRAADDDETSDGEDAATTTAAPAPPPGARAAGSRLGAIGKNKKPSPSPPPPKASQRSSTTETIPADNNSETASEPDVSDSQPASPRPPPKPAARRGGLGLIGGKPKQERPAARSPSPAAPPAASTEESSQLPRRHKLGMIGKKAPSPSPEASAASGSDHARGRSKTPAAEAKKDQIRETSRERADRKRAELQKEIEKRAAAGPAKKKRKF
ncbi:2ca82f2c-d312-4819-a663-aa7117d494f6 [Thermothielavioides terrestris]|uniref:Non-homologous end-joining factor 1 n=2 Tax=Thermothielavioides terrestris TaxID=2587410 RepID=G2RCX1_THETT|nr:uncharacterized protein THITE_2120612 [Thermothielavioides terrestris NRRL 8126]AEO69859.1 hypothetical protein THITE_2120612 [Thermothielavioides terrestris NRRL 8126]SPQ17654.1 2ca82f2c-d312-4819-a663-aa7117d494f6 [Thermothielavioides terrestris]